MQFDVNALQWTRAPKAYKISPDKIEITTTPKRICGREFIIIFGTTTRRCCK